jgi:uncharacterized coiled-coil protein SlyX
VPATELDKEDVLRFVLAEAKKLKVDNLTQRSEIDGLTRTIQNQKTTIDELRTKLMTVEKELEDALQLATAPKTVVVDQALADDLSFLGYPASTK